MRGVLVVRREQSELFEYLKEHFGDEPSIEVLLDRRSGERRRAEQEPRSDRRHSDRRTLPPDTWHTPGYVLVPTGRPAQPVPA